MKLEYLNKSKNELIKEKNGDLILIKFEKGRNVQRKKKFKFELIYYKIHMI